MKIKILFCMLLSGMIQASHAFQGSPSVQSEIREHMRSHDIFGPMVEEVGNPNAPEEESQEPRHKPRVRLPGSEEEFFQRELAKKRRQLMAADRAKLQLAHSAQLPISAVQDISQAEVKSPVEQKPSFWSAFCGVCCCMKPEVS